MQIVLLVSKKVVSAPISALKESLVKYVLFFGSIFKLSETRLLVLC